jgi:hypothetical protein
MSHQLSLCIHNLFNLKFREMNVILLLEVKTQQLNEVYLQQKLGKNYDSECIIQTKFNNPFFCFC